MNVRLEPRKLRRREALLGANLHAAPVRVATHDKAVPSEQLRVPGGAVRVEHLLALGDGTDRDHPQRLTVLVVVQSDRRRLRVRVVEHVPERHHGLRGVAAGAHLGIRIVVIDVVVVLPEREREPGDERGGVKVHLPGVFLGEIFGILVVGVGAGHGGERRVLLEERPRDEPPVVGGHARELEVFILGVHAVERGGSLELGEFGA